MLQSTILKLSDKKPEPFNLPKDEEQGFDLYKRMDYYRKNHCILPLTGSRINSSTTLAGNGFVHTVVDAYNNHHNLTIRPDDIWTAIMVQFSFYVNKESEKFRSKFVNFEGKKDLVVTYPEGNFTSPASYQVFVSQMTEEIHKNLVDPQLKEWALPSFSTTTQDDILACGVVFMATMKGYFNYSFRGGCGIPYLTIEGTLEDWENIRQRIKKLKEYELGWWYNMLKPILREFVNAKKGRVDPNFWPNIVHRFGEEMSGSSPHLTGWITAFCVFNKDGHKQGTHKKVEVYEKCGDEKPIKVKPIGPWPVVEEGSVPGGIVHVNVTLEDLMTKEKYHSVMFAGHIGREVVGDGMTLKPSTGWVICLKKSNEEVAKIERSMRHWHIRN